MTSCTTLFRALDKRLEDKKSLEMIGNELCDGVKNPRNKAIRLVKAHKGNEFLINNAEWLGYNPKYIRSEGRPEENRLKKFNQNKEDKTLAFIKKSKITKLLSKEKKLKDTSKGIMLVGRVEGIHPMIKSRNIEAFIEPSMEIGKHFVNYLEFEHGEDGGVSWEGHKADFAIPDEIIPLQFQRGRRWNYHPAKWKWEYLVVKRRNKSQFFMGEHKYRDLVLEQIELTKDDN